MAKCPKCSSANAKLYDYSGIKIIRCNKCGFDEGSVYEVYPEERTSQKAKEEYAVYKRGGSHRARKK